MSNKHPVNLKKGTQTDPPGTGFTSSHFLLSPRVVLSSLRHQMEDRGNEDTPTTPSPPTLTSRCGPLSILSLISILVDCGPCNLPSSHGIPLIPAL